jgi:hypothetical protein
MWVVTPQTVSVLWPSPTLSPTLLMAHATSSQNFSPYHFLFLVHSTHIYLPMKMEQTECSETLAYKFQTPSNYPKESIQQVNTSSASCNLLPTVITSSTYAVIWLPLSNIVPQVYTLDLQTAISNSILNSKGAIAFPCLKPLLTPFRSYVGPRPTLWFSCSAPVSEDVRHVCVAFVHPLHCRSLSDAFPHVVQTLANR